MQYVKLDSRSYPTPCRLQNKLSDSQPDEIDLRVTIAMKRMPGLHEAHSWTALASRGQASVRRVSNIEYAQDAVRAHDTLGGLPVGCSHAIAALLGLTAPGPMLVS